jgi:hypothetical protein
MKTTQDNQSKFRQESNTERPSVKLRRKKPLITSGQVDPKSPKLKTKAEKAATKENRQLNRAKRRADKSGVKLSKARVKPDNQKPRKPKGIIKSVSSVIGFEVAAKVRGKIHEVERENSAVEAAHKTEIMGERVVRATTRHVKHRIRTAPARRVQKLEKRNIKANANLRFREAVKENPELKKSLLKKQLHKKRIQKRLQSQAKATGGKAVSATKRAARFAVNLVRRNPRAMILLLIGFLIVIIMQSCMAIAISLFSSLGGSVVESTSYLSSDDEINDVSLYYSEWEVDLLLEALDAEKTHEGYDEYRYFLDPLVHDPFAMLAYLTTMYNSFTFDEVEEELLEIFNEQYVLTFTPSVETKTKIDTDTGEEYDVEWHVLTVTLTAQDFEEIITARLETEEEQERYALNMLIKGNRQYIRTPLSYNWLPYVTSNFGYRLCPFTEEKQFHTGIDIALPEGTPLLAGGAGIVMEAGEYGDYGLTILINYGKGISARYAHCSELFFSQWESVDVGDIIALSGDTGASTGAHLHMEIIKSGKYLNPLFFMGGTTD